MEEEIKIGDIVTVTSSGVGIEKEALVFGMTKYSSGTIEYHILFKYIGDDAVSRSCVSDSEIIRKEKGHWPKEALKPGDSFDILFENELHRYKVEETLIYIPTALSFSPDNMCDYVVNLGELKYRYYDENHTCKTIKHKDIFKPNPLDLNETKALSLI